MSQTEFLPFPTTILRAPVWYDNDVREDRSLPNMPGDYKVTPGVGNERWTVTCLKTQEVVYNGIGPVQVLRTQT
ncbi:hypothetical protein GFK26_18215 [Variovorax paradoxus]|uniref:Uncharacterized protein n=1 Tax=Variovorax paradoxus TaxID=34073 RepID=A0A5Q0M7L1_VARPD|nr:hypothetical protein [Variovorax paradoxus]QFZ84564.1 hypothetical protein GFK26_18215 [Variovorax paradoxus]